MMKLPENEFQTRKNNFELLELTETPKGFFTQLKTYLKFLEKDPSTRFVYKKLIEQMSEIDEKLQEEKIRLIEWMKDKLKEMKKLKCAKYQEVMKTLNKLEQILTGQVCEVAWPGGYLTVLKEYFQAACDSIAIYGTCDLRDWLRISIKDNPLIFKDYSLSEKLEEKKRVKFYSREGNIIAKRLGHGFVNARVLAKNVYFGNQDETRIDIQWGVVDSIKYPPSYYAWKKSNDINRWKENCDVSGVENLRLLLLLSKYVDFDPLPTKLLINPTTVFEAEELANQQTLQLFLSGFRSSSWQGAPMSRDEIVIILKKLITFLLVEKGSVKKKKKGINTKRAAVLSARYKLMCKQYEELLKMRLQPRTYAEFEPSFTEIKGEVFFKTGLELTFEEVDKFQSGNLIREVNKKFRKEYCEFIPKRGEAKKKKVGP